MTTNLKVLFLFLCACFLFVPDYFRSAAKFCYVTINIQSHSFCSCIITDKLRKNARVVFNKPSEIYVSSFSEKVWPLLITNE